MSFALVQLQVLWRRFRGNLSVMNHFLLFVNLRHFFQGLRLVDAKVLLCNRSNDNCRCFDRGKLWGVVTLFQINILTTPRPL